MILVVDDEEGVRAVAQRALQRHGFRVVTASDGREALEVFRKQGDEIAVVVLDMTMPRLGGEETLRELRRLREDTRIIVTSGYDEMAVVSRIPRRDAAAFVEKPFKPDQLIDLVCSVLEGNTPGQ